MNTRVDRRFAPAVALLSGLLGGLFVLVARLGWHVLWPVIGVLGALGIVWLVYLVRRDRQTGFWEGVLAATLLATCGAAAVWGFLGSVSPEL